jgi:hypothetical protein
MSLEIPNWYSTEYSRNIDLLLQQKDSRLSGSVMVGTHVGEKASPVDQLGSIEMQDVVGRFNPMGRVDAPTERRWVFPVSSDLPQLIDSFDKLKILTDPQSSYVTNAVAAGMRRKDRHILSAFFANSAIGVNAGSTETFGTTLTTSAGQNVSVGTGGTTSGMNVAKLKAGVRRLMEANVDVEAEGGVNVAISAKQHDELLNELQVINADYGTTIFNGQKLLTSWWVVKFHHTELLTTGTDDAAGTSTQVPMWVKSGMHLGMWESLVTDISQRKDIQGLPWQVYVKMTAGATRLEKNKIVRIWSR